MQDRGQDWLAEGLLKYGQWVVQFHKKPFDQARQISLEIPTVNPQTLQAIQPQLSPILLNNDQRLAARSLELAPRQLVLRFARSLGELGQNFTTGAGFACLVFNTLKDQGINFPPISQEPASSYEADFNQMLLEFAKENQASPDEEIVQSGFLKMLLLSGFLTHQYFESEDPHLVKLFQDFGQSKGFSTEGCLLIYDLKVRELLLQAQS